MDSLEAEEDKSPRGQQTPANPSKIIFNVSDTKYAVVKYVGRKMFGWKLSYKHEDMDWDVMWTDNAVDAERLARMKPFQKINHFPGMYALARKNHLARNLMKLRKVYPKEFNFFPKTWLVPAEHADLKAYMTKPGKKKTFIVKPEASCQGRGIFLTRRIEDIGPDEHYVVQQYLNKPFLIDDFKFDLRIYVLVAGCDPLRIFVHEEGLARLATEKYEPPGPGNLSDMCMHLTNYAINKANPNFIFNQDSDVDDVGHKRSLTSTMNLFTNLGYDVPRLWGQIYDLIIKTLCAVQPSLAHTYRSCQPEDPTNGMCFELLGLDVILDQNFKPYLLEVNHSPSFTADTPLDKKIKREVISQALTLMNIDEKSKRKYLSKQKAEAQERALRGRSVRQSKEVKEEAYRKAQERRDRWERTHLGGYTKIYPGEGGEKYLKFVDTARSIWNEWTGGKKPIAPQQLSRASTPQSLPNTRLKPLPKPEVSLTTKCIKLRSISNSDLAEAEDSEPSKPRLTDVFERLSKRVVREEKKSESAVYYTNILPLDPVLYRTYEPLVVSPGEKFAHKPPSHRPVQPLTLPKPTPGSLLRTLHHTFEMPPESSFRQSPLTVLSLAPKPIDPRPKSDIGRGGYLMPRVMGFTPRPQGK